MIKLLTVSVAAYNMEKYLRRTLESLALPDIVRRLEVFVIDDGGTDGSMAIAEEFSYRYPFTFFPVYKQNGGYGSTINWSLAHATGRYFRPLDGDDWFDARGLRRLIHVLETAEADAIYTPHIRVQFKDDKEVSRKLTGTHMEAVSFDQISDARALGMHRLTYRTSVLRAARLTLPQHIFYTDTIYACAPLTTARTLLSLDFPLYCLRLGREGQSVSKEMRAEHIDDALQVVLMLAEKCRNQRLDNGCNVRQMEEFTAYLNRSMLRQLLRAPLDGRYFPRLRQYESGILARSPAIFEDAAKHGKLGPVIRLLRLTNYHLARIMHPLFTRFVRYLP